MPDLSNQRRLAAALLKCGSGRVWIDPASQEELADAVTRADVRSAIKAGVIRRLAVQGTSRVRARIHAAEVAKGRHQGPARAAARRTPASRRRTAGCAASARSGTCCASSAGSKKIPVSVYRTFYRRAKGGMFRSRAHLIVNLRLAGHLPEEKK